MSYGEITLAGGMRTNLMNLQMTSALQARTQTRLSTGKKVNSAMDDAAAYFAAQSETSRANDLAALKDAMGEAIQTLKAADGGISAITKLIEQAKGVIASARSAAAADLADLAQQFDDIMEQLDFVASDASYKGTNLLDSGALTVTFDETGDATMTISGFDASASGLGIGSAVTDNNAWAAAADIDASAQELTDALSTLRTNAKGLSANAGVITSRQEFTAALISTLVTGAENLTAADVNEEAVNMQALNVQQQLGITALGLSVQSQQAILKLF
jgi:flagellin